MIRTAVRAGALAALSLQILSFTTSALAGLADYVYTPLVQEGERESVWSLGLGYGVTNWWFTEFYAKWHKEPGEQNSFDAWEWENKFQLTETGKYPVDVGFLFEIERQKDRTEG